MAKRSLLVVEDQSDLAQMLDVMFTLEGYDVTAHTDNFEVLLTEDFPWSTYDVLVVDHMLGNRMITGKKIISYVAEHHPTIRRVMLTANTHIKVPQAHIVLHKPVGLDAIIEALHE